ncbi:MAG: serine hydrolase [Rhizobiaceae bacterium]
MKRALKFFGLFVGAILVLGAIVAAFNVDRLKRLHAVNTLFSEDKITANFSNMKGAFAFSPIVDSGEVEKWEKLPIPLPTTYSQNGASKSTEEWLLESKTTSLVVVQNGKVSFEKYFLGTKPDDLRISWSVAKSFLSAAFGIAVKDGLIKLDDTVDKYVPVLKTSAYKGVTVRNVLNMSSGVKFNEDYLDFFSDIKKMGRVLAIGGSMDEFSASIVETERPQGTARQYVSIDTHVLSMVLRAATGKRLIAYLGEKIISPIGFSRSPYYTTDSEGNAFALGGLNITTLDFARFGQMIANGGKWQGQQIVPADWISKSTITSATAPANGDGWGYGYQWWIPPGSAENGGDFIARGVYGQYIYINPKSNTVIVRTAVNRGFRKNRTDGSSAHENNVAMFRTIAATAR